MGLKEGQSEPAGTCKPAKGRTVEINKLKRLMEYGSVRGTIRAVGTCKPAEGRTVAINKLKRMKQYGSIIGVV